MIRSAVKPLEGSLVGCGGYRLIAQILSPSRGDQEKDVVGRRAQYYSQIKDCLDLLQVLLGDGCIDLEFHAPFLQEVDAPQGLIESAGDAPEGVVALPVPAVDADADPPDSRLAAFS